MKIVRTGFLLYLTIKYLWAYRAPHLLRVRWR
jgi:hypothetical protein